MQNDFTYYNWDYYSRGDRFALPFYSRESQDPHKEFKNWDILINEDGSLSVKFIVNIEPSYGHIYNVEAKLHRNEQSIFGGYTADFMEISLAESDPSEEEFLSDIVSGKQSLVLDSGISIGEYTFRLDGDVYTMPIPLGEMLERGWETKERLSNDQSRKELILRKDGKEVFCILWRHGKNEWYIVALKTQEGGEWGDIDFELFSRIKKGDKVPDHREYEYYDCLYFYYYGVQPFFNEEDVLEGFEIRYAPRYIDRNKRIAALCEDVTEEAEEVAGENRELQYGITYRCSQGGEEAKIQLRRLNKVDWGRYITAVFIFRGEKREVLRLIDYSAAFTLCAARGNDMYIQVKGHDTAVHPDSEIISLVRGKDMDNSDIKK